MKIDMKKPEGKKVLVYGDGNIDIFVRNVRQIPPPGTESFIDDMMVCVGGGAALTALGLGTLGVDTMYGGILADDEWGRFVTEKFAKRGVDTSCIRISNTSKTGISISFTDENNRSFITAAGTNKELNVRDVLTLKSDFSHLHVTGYCGRVLHEGYRELLEGLRRRGGVTVSMDVGYDPTGEWYEGLYELLPMIDVFFLNEVEAAGYGRCETPEQAAVMLSQYGGLVVVKLGGAGSIAARGGEIIGRAKPFKVTAVDTTGAGDSFNAGFIFGYLADYNIETALMTGNACGAMSVTAVGGNTAFPDMAKVCEMFKQY